MPPVAIAAGIGAVGSLASGYLASRSANKATKAQSQSNAAALAFERERDARRQANYEAAMGAYRNQWDAWNQGRMALLQRYGVDVTPFQSRPAVTPAPAQTAPAQAPAPVPGGPQTPLIPGKRAGLSDLLQ